MFPGNLSNDSKRTVVDVNEVHAGLEDQIGRLQSFGLVHPTNQMTIKELLDPPQDNSFAMWTTEEIFESQKNNSVDSESDDEDPEPRVKPTAKSVFSAIALINNYIQDEDSMVANHLNHALHNYSKGLSDRLITNARQSSIHDFFKHGTSSEDRDHL
ncbi:uncharacterized protein PGTG_00373 [Puccinia graminis f. sp. tritici CRL 75-36-700-3]|uniref:Uncharacterized protein n=1 Tax=Puccinia graminis f. sp. tritici (strain CRL 75-36-700-3 / race SCCL) TaxID=418459 RepID=E3JQV5_PUCGT|nr:uncharacterized protein PGTG_00373 [Puccinia graminis f. sp. tritici CRL 75-36-700-3]EFP74417.2 hypothetical protein PGTG_00373 [Puccinia graminis f. sp. tritici CRL 75-36-700-3]